MSVTVELVDPQGQLEQEIADPAMKRADIAATYALALRSQDQVDWRKVNLAILERWSPHALRWIKTEAWKLAGR